ncbi:hypothetical protein K2X14_08650 [Acetobacter sp. TBRC 12305]|uniref:Type IV pilus biogenesis protein PilP n=1 Tax=Acetobacter garciniae TaxID=2817435 RepID=A0A939HIP2_9PROT|nr:hypothetical protein [Acetobacter garciniae]MBO1325130.1 hypothetical protein [Acetobacter garciniae]MBX0344899.1 hypothetical protein [Acetobacter garciniae]
MTRSGPYPGAPVLLVATVLLGSGVAGAAHRGLTPVSPHSAPAQVPLTPPKGPHHGATRPDGTHSEVTSPNVTYPGGTHPEVIHHEVTHRKVTDAGAAPPSAVRAATTVAGGGQGAPSRVLDAAPRLMAGAAPLRVAVEATGRVPGPQPLPDAAGIEAARQVILARPLFSPARRPAAGVAAGNGLPRLTAIVVSSGRRRALFMVAGQGRGQVVDVGGVVGPWTVTAIDTGVVHVRGPSGEQVLRPDRDRSAEHPVPGPASGPPSGPVSGPARNPAPPVGPGNGSPPSSSAHVTGPTP